MAEKNLKKTVKKPAVKALAKRKAQAAKVTPQKLELLVTIVGRNKGEYYADLIQSLDVNMQFTVFSRGTADAKMLEYLGLTDTEKSVIFSVIRSNRVTDAMLLLEEKFKTIRDGKGVAFTIPLSSVIGTLIYGFLSNNRTAVKEEK